MKVCEAFAGMFQFPRGRWVLASSVRGTYLHPRNSFASGNVRIVLERRA